MRVLGGVVYVESYAMKPCQDYVAVSAPVDRSSTAISMIPMDPDNPVRGHQLGHIYVALIVKICSHHGN